MRLFKQYFLKFLKVSFRMLLLISPLVILRIYAPQGFISVENLLSEHAVFFRIFRWILIIAFIANWHVLVKLFAKKYHWNDPKQTFWLAQRWRIGAWLIVFELLICENVLAVLFR